MRVQLAGVTKRYGAQVVLDQVTSDDRPARAGRSRRPERRRQVDAAPDRRRASSCPDEGVVSRAPESADGRLSRAGAARVPGESIIDDARRVERASSSAERELEDRADALARARVSGGSLLPRRSSGSSRSGCATSRHRARTVCADLGLGVDRRPRARRPLGRRGRPRRPGGDPPLAVRRAPARRADERPRLRRPRAAGGLPRGLSRRASSLVSPRPRALLDAEP